MDPENFGGARWGASIDFQKHWGGRGPPGPPSTYTPGFSGESVGSSNTVGPPNTYCRYQKFIYSDKCSMI